MLVEWCGLGCSLHSGKVLRGRGGDGHPPMGVRSSHPQGPGAPLLTEPDPTVLLPCDPKDSFLANTPPPHTPGERGSPPPGSSFRGRLLTPYPQPRAQARWRGVRFLSVLGAQTGSPPTASGCTLGSCGPGVRPSSRGPWPPVPPPGPPSPSVLHLDPLSWNNWKGHWPVTPGEFQPQPCALTQHASVTSLLFK